MKVVDKMNKLVGTHVSKKRIKDWAYMNRITVVSLPYEEEFSELEATVEAFIQSVDYGGIADEHEAWDRFLDFDYVEEDRK